MPGSRGKVYLVGAGPGDAGLITVRGAQLIQSADVIVTDALVNPALFEGVRGHIINAGKRGRASEREPRHGPPQSDINRLLVRLARGGRQVVRLKGGDPFVFGRGSEELEALKKAGISFEVVPGVSSATAVPAYAGIPVTDRRWASQVTFITGHERQDKSDDGGVDWARLSPAGTLVVLMGVSSWPSIRNRLLGLGWKASLPAAAIVSGTWRRQRVIRSTLGRSAVEFRRGGLGAPAVIVVGAVAALSSRLSWLEKERPLLGRRIVVTRAADRNDRLMDGLRLEGAEPVACPLIETKPISSPELARLRMGDGRLDYDWLVLLSASGARLFAEALGPSSARRASVRTIAVGPLTAEAARAAGWRVVKVPARFTSNDLRRAMGNLKGKSILLPRAVNAPVDVVRAMERAGAAVDVVPVYETRPLSPTRSARQSLLAGVDAVTFLSASAVEAFFAGYNARDRKRIFSKAVAVSIGPSTTQALRRRGVPRLLQSSEATTGGVLTTLRRFFGPK